MTGADEDARVAALRRLAILDTEPEPGFDALVRLATAAFGVRSAVISFIDDRRQWIKAGEGFSLAETDRAEAFCRYALVDPQQVMVVLDARVDPRFSASPLVTGEPFVRFYAGTPLLVDGFAVGALCLLDPEPRETFSAPWRSGLQALGATVTELLRLRLETAANREKTDALGVASRKMALAEELSGVGHWSLEIGSGRVSWSTQVYRIHGVDPETFDPQLGHALDFYAPQSRAEVEASLKTTIKTGRGFNIKARLVRASDGALRTVVSRGEMTSSEDGAAAVVGVFQDVTEQEALLHQIEADRERYRLLTQNTNDVIATYDLKGVFTYVSPSIERMIGVSAESLVGRRTYDIIHADDHARIAGEFAAFLRSGAEETRIEYRILPAAGAPFWVEAHPSPMRDPQGRVVGFQDSVRDVSARRAAEQAASESERRYRLLAENANDMIALTSTEDSTIFFVSPGSRRVLGYEPKELVGRATLTLTHPDDRPAVMRHFSALLEAGPTEAVTPYQFRGLHKDGTWVWLEGQPRVQYDAGGAPIAFQDVVRDISQRKRLESHLQSAREVAESATRAKSDFLANMSHELRTPLTGILGYADVLAEAPALDAASRRHAELIGRSGRALLELVNDVLDLSKIEAGGLDLSPRPTDLGALVSGAIDAVRPQAEAKGLSLSAELPPSPPHVSVDADRLQQVLLNLLSNAIKFTDAGEVHLTLAAEPSGPGHLALDFAVSDTGIGIDEHQLTRIFGRFEQADASITRRFGGTGLGLSISRAIVERMGGRLTARGEVGRGSVFTASLDLPKAVVRAVEAPAERPVRTSLDGLRVLVAEDLAINRELISLFLGKHGVVLTCVENGAEAVEAAARQAFDAVLMDVQMPVLDGVEATRRIRASGGPNAGAPILALTANVLPTQIALCRAAGMTHHVEKPFTSETLAAALEATLSGPPDAALRHEGAAAPHVR